MAPAALCGRCAGTSPWQCSGVVKEEASEPPPGHRWEDVLGPFGEWPVGGAGGAL